MAMSQLKVTPQKLKNEANDFKSNANKVRNISKEMMNVINSITGQVWSGDAATEYTGRFKKLDDDMDKIYDMIIEYANDLNDIADQYIKTENQNDQLASGLAIDL